MTFQDLLRLYEIKKQTYGTEAYRHISNLLREAKNLHQEGFTGNDHEQSWRAFKGKNLEKLIESIIIDEVRALGLEVVNGNTLERSTNLSLVLGLVKRNLLVDYGEFGCHLPDADLIIYVPTTSKVIALLSSKTTLRERVAQTGYWKMKLVTDEVTRHIKMYLVTPDEDGTLTNRNPLRKGRAIVEIDTDGAYVLSEATIEESSKVKMFDKFIEDLRTIIQ